MNFRFIVPHYVRKRVEVELYCRFGGFNLRISVHFIVLAVVLTTRVANCVCSSYKWRMHSLLVSLALVSEEEDC